MLEHYSQSIRLTVSQSGRQEREQAGSEAGRHAGRNTQFAFFGGSLHRQLLANARRSVGLNPIPNSRLHDGLSPSHFADQGSNPTNPKTFDPHPHPQPPKNWYPSRGGGGVKIEIFISGSFCFTKY